MAAAFRASNTAAGTTGTMPSPTTITLTKPTGTVNGDVMLTTINMHSTGAITTLSGWTLVRSDTYDFSTATMATYRRVASSEGSSYTWTLPGGVDYAAGIASYSGCDTTPTITSGGNTGTTAGTTFDAPTISPAAAGNVLVSLFGADADRTYTPPGSETERFDVSAGAAKLASLECGTEVLAASGATGVRTVTASASSNNYCAHNIAIAPAAATGKLFRQHNLDGIGTGGPFFSNPLGA